MRPPPPTRLPNKHYRSREYLTPSEVLTLVEVVGACEEYSYIIFIARKLSYKDTRQGVTTLFGFLV